jgi:polysaccharide pyruvyl transferase WcaK-like protein
MKITLAFGWGMGNIGDVAITPGMIETLKKYFPDAELNVISIYEKKTEHYKLFKEHLLNLHPECKIWSNPFTSFLQGDEMSTWLTASAITSRPAVFMRKLAKKSPEFCGMFASTDLLLLNSGMMLSYNRLGESSALGFLLSLWFPLILARQLDIPYTPWGQSCGPFDPPADVLAKEIMQDSLMITTRETESLKLIREMGIPIDNSSFGPDTTVEFTSRDDEWAERYMTQNNLQNKQFAIFIIRSTGWWNKRIEDNRFSKHMNFIAQGIEYCTSKLGLKAIIAPECSHEIANAKEHLWPLLDEATQRQTILMDKFWMPEQAKSLYAKAFAVSSMELHSIFLAVPEGTPVIHTWFEEMGPKTFAMRDFWLDEFLINIDHNTDADYCNAFKTIQDNYSNITERVFKGANKFHDTVQTGMTELKRRLKKREENEHITLTPF